MCYPHTLWFLQFIPYLAVICTRVSSTGPILALNFHESHVPWFLGTFSQSTLCAWYSASCNGSTSICFKLWLTLKKTFKTNLKATNSYWDPMFSVYCAEILPKLFSSELFKQLCICCLFFVSIFPCVLTGHPVQSNDRKAQFGRSVEIEPGRFPSAVVSLLVGHAENNVICWLYWAHQLFFQLC